MDKLLASPEMREALSHEPKPTQQGTAGPRNAARVPAAKKRLSPMLLAGTRQLKNRHPQPTHPFSLGNEKRVGRLDGVLGQSQSKACRSLAAGARRWKP